MKHLLHIFKLQHLHHQYHITTQEIITSEQRNNMFSLIDSTNHKKKSCEHNFKTVWPQGTQKAVEVCTKCGQTKKQKAKNGTLIPYLQVATAKSSAVLAFKQSITILAGVSLFVETSKLFTNWKHLNYQGWRMPSTRGQYSWCGIWRTLGCLNYVLHQLLGKGKRVYIKQYMLSCYRASCATCYLKWIMRDSDRAKKRIEKYIEKHPGKIPMHLMLLPPPSQFDIPYDKLKERMLKIIKIADWEGGAVVFHPFKPGKRDNEWKVGPHFHLVGFGDRTKMVRAYGKFGWLVKDGGDRRSVFQTMCYLLSHCGVKKGHHSVIWIGKLSYRKLKMEKERKITCCPVCEDKFIPVSHEGPHPIVEDEKPFEGLVDDDGKWHPA